MIAISTFRRLAELWNQMSVGTINIYLKYLEQLMQYYKLEAIKAKDAKLVLAALQHAQRGLESENGGRQSHSPAF